MGIYFHSIFDTASLLLQSGKMTFFNSSNCFLSIPRNLTTRIASLIPLQGIGQHAGVGTDGEVV